MSLNRRSIHLALCALVLSIVALTGSAGSASAYVNGHDALKDKPFVAGLRTPGTTKFFCTATLLHKDWVLTAAHCLDGGKKVSDVEVVIGDTNLNDSTDPAETRSPDRLELHPKWGGDAGDKNDVALLHLSTPSTLPTVRLGVTPAFTAGVKRCTQLARYGDPMMVMLIRNGCVSGKGKALGWGRTKTSGNSTSSILREVTPRIFAWSERTFWRVKSGACPGDSGGPLLVLAADGSPRQIGVASYAQHGGGYFDWVVGDRCSDKGMDYYSDVSAGTLRTWVESITRIRDHRS